MIEISLEKDHVGLLSRTRHAPGEEITIGSAATCTLRDAGLEPEHCALWVRAAGCFVIDRCGHTRVNGKAIAAPRALYREDIIDLGRAGQAGGVRVFVERVAEAAAPIELQFLADIRGGDFATREVYADWLDEQGDPRRAEFLRLEDFRLADPANVELPRRLAQLAVVIDLDWRIAVGRGRVERCDRACDQDWGKLLDAGAPNQPKRRRCPECRNFVAYCERIADAADSGVRVVIDASVWRVPGDLPPRT